MPSFDVVSKTDVAELDNAINGVSREIKQRYDFKGSMCSIDRSANTLTIIAENELLLKQMHGLLAQYCVKRGIDNGAFEFKDPESAAKGTLRQEIQVLQGIDQTTGRDIIKTVKGSKLKVQIVTQGTELRVTGKNRDDLQQTIQVIKDLELKLPIQYVNFRD
jgi:uncharacterized protein YajQ (UPF0234 family)